MTPYVIAELSANHNGSLDRAFALVDAAAEAGCAAIKLQTLTPDGITLDYPYHAKGLWAGRTLYELYTEVYTPWEWHPLIFERARRHNLDCISTPFDLTAVGFLDCIGVDAYKVASYEITWLALIEAIARRGRPVYISTGMATEAEVVEAYRTVRPYGQSLTMLKCSSAYPALPEHLNLRTLFDMRDIVPGARLGFSDHTLGWTAAVTAVALGAEVIEKHLTLSRLDGGPDAAFSAEPHEMRALVAACRDAALAVGNVTYGPQDGEDTYYRRSLIVTQDILAGGTITRENVEVLRPCIGIEPKFLNTVLGMTVKRNVARGAGLQWHHFA